MIRLKSAILLKENRVLGVICKLNCYFEMFTNFVGKQDFMTVTCARVEKKYIFKLMLIIINLDWKQSHQ